MEDALDVSGQTELRTASRAFVASAFEVLMAEHVIPRPVYDPYVAVGHDYFGGSIMPLAEYAVLENLLKAAHPERFHESLIPSAEFASTYIFSFLEACIARCTRAGNLDPMSGVVDELIDELRAVLVKTTYDIVCARHVCHMTTVSGEEVQIGDITVVPEPEGYEGLGTRIEREIGGAPRAWNRDVPRPHDPPHSLLILREATAGPNPYEDSNRLSGELDRFLLLTRLLTAGTVQSSYEVSGVPTLVAPMPPLMRTSGKASYDLLVRRTVRLTGQEAAAFAALGDLIDAADVKREGMLATSFDVALSKYDRSHNGGNPYEHLVDLATALEAVLIGTDKENEGLTLRLRTRVAALLTTEEDPSGALFDDVGLLYTLRSKLVHGGQIKETELRRIINRISTVPDDAIEHRFGTALHHAVDRMRDLVRRAILARLCLAAKPESLWPLYGDTKVDATLADDVQRNAWRKQWRARLAELGVEYVADRPRSAVDFLSPEDR
ncbi:hypothetical protein [Rhodococcus opacus]|uniref:hypothetical protein n=1 Tax=Rhodococcus opacus TaxID=37919 RepID=UPI0037C72D8B